MRVFVLPLGGFAVSSVAHAAVFQLTRLVGGPTL